MAPLSPSTVLYARLSINIVAVVPLLTAATGVLLGAETWSIAAWLDPLRRTVHTAKLAAAAVFPGTDWQTATPLAMDLDPVKFQQAMDMLPSPVVVIKSGKIVGAKGDIASSQPIWSASKSLTALVAARLIQQAQIDYDSLVPGSGVPSQPQATYRQFMTMSSDYNLTPHDPGGHYAYNNEAVAFYGQQMQQTYFPGQSVAGTLYSAFGTTLQFQDEVAEFDVAWNGGIYLSTRDLARVGYLVLRNGTWNGTQLIPSSFVADLYVNKLTGVPVSPDVGNGSTNEFPFETEMSQCYSYGFWIVHLCPDKFRGQTQIAAITMWGSNASAAYIAPELDMVIASANPNPGLPFEEYWRNTIPAMVLDAFAAATLPPDTTPPTVSVTNPQDEAEVSGTITIAADASDDRVLVSVQFKINGVPLGPEDDAAPFSRVLDTRTVTNGDYSLTATALDASGNETTSEPVDIRITNIPPGTINLSPTALTFSAGTNNTAAAQSVAISNSGAGPLNYSISANQSWCHANPQSGVVTAGGNISLSVSLDTLANPGKYSCVVSVVDPNATNNPQQINVAYMVTDTTPPQVAVTSPVNNATVNGTVTIAANATDNAGVAGVQFKINGQNQGAEDTTAPYSVTWDTTFVLNGTVVLAAVARDINGYSTTAATNVTVANTSPGTIGLTPTTLSFTANVNAPPAPKTVTVSNTGIGNLNYTAATNQTWCVVSPVSGALVRGMNQLLTVSVNGMAAGTYACVVTVADPKASNNPRTVNVSYTVNDNIAPTVSVTAPANGAILQRKANVTIAATASDNVGVTKVEFYVDNSKKCTDTAAPFSCVWQTPNAKGSYVITARAYDAKGNVTVSASITVKTN